MDSTLTSTRADPRFDDGAAATAPNAAPAAAKNSLGSVEETLARLARQAASDKPEVRPRAPAADKSADIRIAVSPDAPKLGADDLSAYMLPRDELSAGKRGVIARIAIAARIAIGVCVLAAVVWGWRSYGGPAGDVITALAASVGGTSAHPAAAQNAAPAIPDPAFQPTDVPRAVATPVQSPAQAAVMAPPATPAASQSPAAAQPAATAAIEPAAAAADHQQMEAMARDVAALRQTIAQLTAGQEQLKDQIAKLQVEKAVKAVADQPPAEKPKKHPVHHASARPHAPDAFNPAQEPNAPGAPRTIGSVVVRHPAPPYAAPGVAPSAPGVTTVGPVSTLPPPQEPGVRRPPMPVPEQP